MNQHFNTSDDNTALGGCRILDLTDSKGDYCTKLLADLGADVVKIEPPEGDPTRRLPPFKGDLPDVERSLQFLYFGANKRSITLNLDSEDGRAIFKSLAARADAVVESFQPGTLEVFGLGYDALKAINPGIVLTSVTDFGQTGPFKGYRGNDLVDMAMGGLLNRCGDSKMPPCAAPGTLAYDTACMYAAIGTIFALNYRYITGLGQHLDVSVQEAVAVSDDYSIARFNHDHTIGQRNGSVIAGLLPSGIYPCKDGYVRMTVLTPEAWDAFYDWMGKPEMLADPIWRHAEFRGEHPDVADSYIIDFTMQHTREYLEIEGQKRAITVTPVNTPSDFVNDDHEKARGYFMEVEHPKVGRAFYPGAPYRLRETPWQMKRCAPLLGEHNAEILEGELGLSQKEMATLRAAGVI